MSIRENDPSVFLARLREQLQTLEGVDAELAEIVAARILTTEPGDNAIELAFRDIQLCAQKRAGMPKRGENV